jgi:hypothetical protein
MTLINSKTLRAFFTLILFCFAFANYGQCSLSPVRDTMSLPGGKVCEGEYLETQLKKGAMVRIFKTDDNRYFLRLIVTANFYFGKTDVLEIRSGKKSYYEKDCKQHKMHKTAGLFVLEIFRNYMRILRDEGITGLVFAGAETDFTRQDAAQIRAIANCFYEPAKSK